MPTFGNRARVSTATTGTGTITLGSPVTGLQSFAAAGVLDGNTVRYVIEDGTAWEIGTGVYTASGTTLTRGPTQSSIGGAEITLTGSAQVFLSVAAEDMAQLTDIQEFTTVGTTTWIKPVGAKYVHVVMHGGGGGGGSGRLRPDSTTAAAGGGGGGGGGRVEFLLPADSIGVSVSLTIGAGGTGGAAQTVSGSGLPGGNGDRSSFDVFGARGGTGGGGGLTGSGPGGVSTGDTTSFANASNRYSGNSSGGTTAAVIDAGRGGLHAGGGCGGPGNAASSTVSRTGAAGGLGGSAALASVTVLTGGGGNGGGAGANGFAGPDAPDLYFGGGGGGGGGVSTTATVVGTGGAGGFPGGGGGGGPYGQLNTGATSGAGGNGGGGAIRITTFF